MKKLVLLSVSVISIALSVSCEKSELKNELKNEFVENSNVLESVCVNDAGMLEFRDFDEFDKFLDVVITLSYDEYSSWERAKGFYSYRTRIEEVSEILDCIENEYKDDEDLLVSNIMDCVKNNSDVLKCIDLENGESSIEFVMPSTIYVSIMNKDGYYAIGDSIYRVGTDKIYSVHKRDIGILNVENLEMLEGLDNVSLMQYIQTIKTEKTRQICLKDDSYYISGENSDHDRAVTINLYLSIAGNSGNYRVYGHLYVYGQKYVAGRWWAYKTLLSCRNVSCKAVCGPYHYEASYTFPNQTDVNDRKIEDEVQIYSSSTYPEFFFRKAYGEATSRGIGDYWVVLDCTYNGY